MPIDCLAAAMRLGQQMRRDWAEASAGQATFFKSLGPRVPHEMFDEQKRLADALDTRART